MYFSIDKDCPHSSATSLNNNFEVDEGDANTADSGQIFPGGCLDGLNLEATKGLVEAALMATAQENGPQRHVRPARGRMFCQCPHYKLAREKHNAGCSIEVHCIPSLCTDASYILLALCNGAACTVEALHYKQTM
eukprot:CAMPEP_0169305624 /NCGR_PEP_ID=MMETSP1017-20121227/244_1 /TAXON_ID=342587 /ORGANISM="Karlodinium micrum, Strain CCMP2283" /LENGTH=134 /DNA_ID=CAMNT_0009398629 /DNA_START=477 /DNA_END=882 /DNA_ORIENTATION=-